LGRLRHLGSGADWLLRGRNFIGRSRSCTICLDHPEVSGEHAVLRWSGSAWEIKDLSSRNGVFVDGQRLPSGDRTTVGAGTRLGFGRDAGYLLVDAGEPIAFATPVTGGAPVEAVGGLLALPGPESPTAMIFRDGDGWSVEQAGDTAGLADDSLIRIGDQSWRLHLPELLSPTDVAADISPQLDDLLLRFSVSRDEEYVELVAVHDRQEFDLQARSHHYALLLLARARLRQSSAPARPPGLDPPARPARAAPRRSQPAPPRHLPRSAASSARPASPTPPASSSAARTPASCASAWPASRSSSSASADSCGRDPPRRDCTGRPRGSAPVPLWMAPAPSLLEILGALLPLQLFVLLRPVGAQLPAGVRGAAPAARRRPTCRRRRESLRAIGTSLGGNLGNVLLTAPIHWAILAGYSRVYFSVDGVRGAPWLLVSVVLVLLVTETLIYWIHRALHVRWLYVAAAPPAPRVSPPDAVGQQRLPSARLVRAGARRTTCVHSCSRCTSTCISGCWAS
jgi:hypothetical protein